VEHRLSTSLRAGFSGAFADRPELRLQRLLKKSEMHVPRGLKSAREDKNKELNGTAEAVPFQNKPESDFSATP
jgi:hypothetical protein